MDYLRVIWVAMEQSGRIGMSDQVGGGAVLGRMICMGVDLVVLYCLLLVVWVDTTVLW